MESKILKLVVAVIGMAAFGAFGDVVPTTLREMYDTNTLYTATQVDQKIAEATGGGASTNYVNDATNEVYKSAVKYTDAAVSDKATTNDTTLTERTGWDFSGLPPGTTIVRGPTWDGHGYWQIDVSDGMVTTVYVIPGEEDADFITVDIEDSIVTAVRRNGYVLGSQTTKPLASEAEAEALRTGKLDKSDLDPLLFAQYYPDGSVKSAAEFTQGIKYNAPDTTNHTITVKPFCNTGTATNDNSSLVGRVVIPPFVDASGNGYISDDGTRYKVVGVSGGRPDDSNSNLTAIVAPNTVTDMGSGAFTFCSVLTTVSFSAAAAVGGNVFESCSSLASISLPAVTTIGEGAFLDCPVLTTVSLPATTNIGIYAFEYCDALESIDFGDTPRPSVPTLGAEAFDGVPTTCKIIVPDSLYDEWIAAPNWSTLYANGYKFLKHSEWEYARKYETVPTSRTVNGKALTNDVTLTGADIAVDASEGAQKIDAALAGKLDKSGGTMTGPLTEKHGLVLGKESGNDFDGFKVDVNGIAMMTNHAGGQSTFDEILSAVQAVPNKANRASNPTAGNLAALDAQGNPTDSGLSKTNVVTFAYDVNSNRTAVTVGVPRHNDPNFEAETPELDDVGEFFTVPALVGPHSLAITGDDESDPYRGTVASGTGSIAANKSVATNRFSVALGYNTFAAGEAAVSHGRETSALGGYSHSEGQHARAVGLFSHAEGESTEARGWGSHAEGVYAEADGRYAHAEGNNTLAEGDYSHAEGASTYASGLYSHAEGNQSRAVGHSAHSDGINAHATNVTSYVWQGASAEDGGVPYKPGAYYSHGIGTYNVNPNGGLAGFWVGESNLVQHINAALVAELANKLDSKVTGERCTTSGTWCVNDGIMGTDIIFSTGAFSESTTPNNNINNGSYITFNPSYFGMSNYETIQKFTVRARSNSGGGWPGNFVGYARLLNAADLNTVLAVSEQFTVSNFNQTVEIGLKPHVLLDTNNTYMIQFVTSLDSQTLAENIPLRLVVGSASPLCYVNGNTSWKPIMTVNHFMSMSGQMQAIVAALQSGNFNTIQGIADTMTAMSASVGVSASQQSPNRFASSSSSTGSGSTTLRVGTNADLYGN